MNGFDDTEPPYRQEVSGDGGDPTMGSFPWTINEPIKTGEIFRNNDGQYSFVCFNCGLLFEDFGSIIGHCESHFREEKFIVDVPSEFVLCGTETELPRCQHPFSPGTTSTTEHPTDSWIPSDVTDGPCQLSSSSDATSTLKRKKPSKKESDTVQRRKIEYSNALSSNFPQNCPMCDVWCNNFREHMKKEHKFKSMRVFQCYICKKCFKEFRALERHVASVKHVGAGCYQCAMEPPIQHPAEPRRHKCLFCKEWFPNHVEFKIHFRQAHDKNADYFFDEPANCDTYTCYVCEREFQNRRYLTAHMKCHDDKFLTHQCTTCGRRFRRIGHLSQHLKMHENKIFTCEQCGKEFPYYERLRVHLETHTTELRFQCESCPKAFKRKKYLNIHKALHVNAKKYACKFCDARFNFQAGRRGHEKTYHGAL